MGFASVRRGSRVVSGAFKGGGVRGLRIDAVGKEGVDNDKGVEMVGQEGKGKVVVVLAPNSGEKDRVRTLSRRRHEDQEVGCQCLHGQDAQALQQGLEAVEDLDGHGEPSTTFAVTGASSSNERSFMRASNKSARVQVSKPVSSQSLSKYFFKD